MLDSAQMSQDPEAVVRKATDFLGLPPRTDVEYPRYNKREYDPVDPGIRERFGHVFEESITRLREMLPEGTLSWL